MSAAVGYAPRALRNDDATITAKNNAGTLDGHVILTGFVPTEKEVQRAAAIAGKIPGVKKINRNHPP